MKRSIFFLYVLAFAFRSAAQDYTPAPVDLTGAPGLSAEYGNVQGYVDALGEFYLWNSSDRPLGFDGFTVACEAACLDATKHVDLGTQGRMNLALVDVYGEGLLDFAVAGTPGRGQISNLSLPGAMIIPPGPEWAISLGKIVDADEAQLSSWAANGDSPISLAMSSPGCVCENLVQYAPEPSAVTLLAFLTACAALRGLSKVA